MQARITGTTMPVLEFVLEPNESIISEAGELSWMGPSIQMTTHTQFGGGGGLFGVLKRVASGGSIFMTEYRAMGAPAELAFATKMPGHIVPVEVAAGHEYLIHWSGLSAVAGRGDFWRQRLFVAAGQRAGNVLAGAFRRAGDARFAAGRKFARSPRPCGRVSIQRVLPDYDRAGNQEFDFRRRWNFSGITDRPRTSVVADAADLETGARALRIHAA